MGRLATYIAGKASSADKLPGQLPNVSLIDALCPRIVSISPSRNETKPLVDRAQDRNSSRGSVTHSVVSKDKKGKLVLVQHRDKSVGIGSGGDGQATPEDAKKDGGATNDKASNGGKADEKKDGAVDENELNFTPEEDAKLLKMKADNPSGPWATVAEELGKKVHEVKQRHQELKKLSSGPSEDAKGDSKLNNSIKNDSKKDTNSKESQKNAGGTVKLQEGDWTAAEDAILLEMSSKGEKNQNIAALLDGRSKKDVGRRLHELKGHDGGDMKNAEGEKAKGDQNAKGGGGEGKKNGENNNNHNKNKKKNEKQQAGKEESAPKEEAKPKAPSSKAGSKAGGKAGSRAGSSRSEAKFTMGEWMTLQEDDMFNFRELQLLSELIITDLKESRDGVYSWLRVASLFTDRTGRRVHPEDIREKFESMARD